jgi:sugar lactone lactonase YvrE
MKAVVIGLVSVAGSVAGGCGGAASEEPPVTLVGASDRIFTVAGVGMGQKDQLLGHRRLATAARLSSPVSVAVQPDGGFLIAEQDRDEVRRVSPAGMISTVAGSLSGGERLGDRGPATKASLSAPRGVAVMPDGGFLIADNANARVRRVSPNGTISTIAGTGGYGSTGDGGPAIRAKLSAPDDVAVGPDGSIYINDTDANRIRRIKPNGVISTFAGGKEGFGGDGGPARRAGLDLPDDIAVAQDGALLIADSLNHRVRRVAPSGTITTVAGGGRKKGRSADGGRATAARLGEPGAVSIAPNGGFVFSDTTVHRVTPDGTITTIAGTGNFDSSGDGARAGRAGMGIDDVAVTPDGGLLIADALNQEVRFVAPASTTRVALAMRPLAGRASRSTYRVRYVTPLMATVHLELFRGRRRVAEGLSKGGPTGGDATASGTLPAGVETVRATAEADGRVASRRFSIFVGDRLTGSAARRAVGRYLSTGHFSEIDPSLTIARCHRFGPRRIDCALTVTDDPEESYKRGDCWGVIPVFLPASGAVYIRGYRCPRRGRAFRRHPRFERPTFIDL